MKKINVTKTYLPDFESFSEICRIAWQNGWLTNRGQLVLELEDKLKHFLQTKNILLTNNGTIPIQMALKKFGNNGEIITTPFSYVATTSSIVWENCKPIFVDIRPDTLNIDPEKIESKITKNTTCILATHVFGNPCDIQKIEAIANKHNLKVIYDAAHCFGTLYKGESIFNFGDISTCSFHSTKIFHTAEGGALFVNNTEFFEELYSYHNFGHKGKDDFVGVGINAKMSEIHAAIGLSVLPNFNFIMSSRKELVELYKSNLNFKKLRTITINKYTNWNYSYFPIILNSTKSLNSVLKALNKKNIYPRRYFYPSLNKLPYVNYQEMPISESIAGRILCLPLYIGLKFTDIEKICETINKNI